MLLLPATAATVAGFLAAAEAAPDGLTTIANVMNCRPLPFVPPEPPEPPEPHGSIVILALVCWAGDTAAGLEAMAPFLALAEPIANLVAPMLYPQIFPPEDPDYHPTAVSRTMFVDSVGPDEATTIVELLQASDATLRVAQLRVLGGAVARVPRPGAYVNFLQDEGPERIRAAYPGATWDRLAAVKATYDPQNVFRLNQNVPPAGAR
jgi:hypothetical protein